MCSLETGEAALRLSYLFSWTTLLLRMNRLPVHLPNPVCEVPPKRILRLLSYEEGNGRQTNFPEIHPLHREIPRYIPLVLHLQRQEFRTEFLLNPADVLFIFFAIIGTRTIY